MILNYGAGDIKSGSSWDDGGRRSLVKGLASRWACTAVCLPASLTAGAVVCSHASRQLTCLLGRHVKAFTLTWQVFVPKYLGSSFVQLVISSLSQIEEKNYEVIFVPYHVTLLSFKNLCSLLDFLKFKIQDSKQYHNLHHAINFQAIHLSCCISYERIWSNILLS